MIHSDPFEDWLNQDDNSANISLIFIKADEKISENEHNTLKDMLKSKDLENKFLAKEIIKNKDNEYGI